ncbi:MAG: CoA transferase, partial [Rhodospirillales bacterium]|nr:CoA transferase [Rhodospirillales bacterium]
GVFKTKDGHINIASTGDKMWRKLCELIDEPGMVDHPDFATGKARSKNRDAVNAAIEKHTVAKTSAEWIKLLNKAGIPSGPIYSIDQVFADQQVKHLGGMKFAVEHPELGRFDVLGQAVKMSRSKPRATMATPIRGQHTDEVLAEFGFGKDEIADLRRREIV